VLSGCAGAKASGCPKATSGCPGAKAAGCAGDKTQLQGVSKDQRVTKEVEKK